MEEKQYVTEWANENLGLTLKITKMLHEEQTPYQKIQIADTLEYGRLLILDGVFQTSVKDEWTYHEMISHVPLMLHPNPERVLIIGGGDGGGDRLIIAHLADQNDIRVLAQGAAQRRGKAARIRADLALVDERLPALIDILDGVLDRDDVVAAGLIDMVDHRGQRGGLAAAGGAGDKDQTARLVRQLCQHGRHRQLCQRGDGIVEQAQRGRSPPLLEKDIYAAAGAVRCDQRKIGIDPLGKNGLAVRLIHQPKDQGAGLVSAHLHGGLHQPPVHPEHQGQPLGEMDVAGFHLPRQRGEFMDLHGTYLTFEKEKPERALPSAPVPLIPHRR